MLCNQCGIQSPAEANFCIRCGADLNRTAALRRPSPNPVGAGAREWQPGDILVDRYKVMEKCGAGGMGVVYKAFDLVLEMVVAIKALHPILVEDTHAIEHMHREARAAMSLAHSNIVRIYTFDDREKILVMEYVEGQALDKRLAQQPNSRLPVDEAAHYIKQICEGLQCAYLAGVVHCDIKPANLLITAKGELKIADFGIARVAKDSITRRFTLKSLAGTPHYMSPEQWRNVRNLDIRTDLYSVGVILYQLLTGHVPYEDGTVFAIGLKHINDPIPDPRSHMPDLPEWVTPLIQKAMAKRPEDRYPTPQALLGALPNQVAVRAVPPTVQPLRRGRPSKPRAQPILPPSRRRVPIWMVLTLTAMVATLGGTLYERYQRNAWEWPWHSLSKVDSAPAVPTAPRIDESKAMGSELAALSPRLVESPAPNVLPTTKTPETVSTPIRVDSASRPARPVKSPPQRAVVYKSSSAANLPVKTAPAPTPTARERVPARRKTERRKLEAKKEQALALRAAQEQEEAQRKEEALRAEEARRLEAQRQAEIQITQAVINQAEATLKWARQKEAELYARDLYEKARSSLGQAMRAQAGNPAEAERWAIQARDAAMQAGQQAPITKAQAAINDAAAALKIATDKDAERYAAARLTKARKALDEARNLLPREPQRALDSARAAKAAAEDAVHVTTVVNANQAIHEAEEARIHARAAGAEKYAADAFRQGSDFLQQALSVIETDATQATHLAQRALASMHDSIALAKRRTAQTGSEAAKLVDADLTVSRAGRDPSCHDTVYFELDGRSLGRYRTPAYIPLTGITRGRHSYFARVRRYCDERVADDFIGSGTLDLSLSRSFRLSVCGRSLCLE